MKTRYIHSALSYLLIATLLFSQIGVSFFHTRHDEHGPRVETPANQDTLQQHGEHCKVCSIDVFNHAFINQFIAFTFSLTKESFGKAQAIEAVSFSYFISNDRAPPAMSPLIA